MLRPQTDAVCKALSRAVAYYADGEIERCLEALHEAQTAADWPPWTLSTMHVDAIRGITELHIRQVLVARALIRDAAAVEGETCGMVDSAALLRQQGQTLVDAFHGDVLAMLRRRCPTCNRPR